MTARPISSRLRNASPVVAALLAGCAALLQAQEGRERKPQQEPRREAPAEPKREAKREAPAEPRREAPAESRRESRREAPAEPRRDLRREMPSREMPSREPRPESSSRREGTVPPGNRETRPGREPRPETLTRTPDRRSPEGRTPEGRTPEGRTPEGRTPEGRTSEARTGPSREARSEPRPGPERHEPARQVVKVRTGGEIHRAPSGAIREVRTPGGAVIRHAPSGVRHVEAVRPGGLVVVANATGRRGYVQRPLVIHNHTYVQRTYVHLGVPHARIYRPWNHGGHLFHIYTPVHFYRPAFYSWCYTPWRRPVRYGWGWDRHPWYGYYGGYFTPYVTYRSPAFWLADFLLATTLEAAFLAQRATISAPPMVYTQSTALSPEVKDAIADEVRRQMDLEREEQRRGSAYVDESPSLFSERGPRVFVVAGPTMAFSGGQECPLVEGDVLQLVDRPSPSASTAEVKVLASRGDSCRKGSYLQVPLTDLQEMQNHLRATLDQGMTKLQSEQGRNGLPTLPSGAAGTLPTAYAREVQPDRDAADQITQVVQEANRSEQDIIAQGPQDPGGATISLGMTPDEVERAMGRPKNTVDLGAKRIYIYKDLKITFLNGRVSDVQ